MILFTVSVQSQDYKNIIKIEFNTLSKSGISEESLFTKDSIIYRSIDRRSQNVKYYVAKKIKKKDYKKLIKSLNNVTLKEIPSLKSPTMKRAFDGANHSEIVITTKDHISYKHRFDDENPHECLISLMNLIKTYQKKMQ